jgi:acetyl esterase
MTGSSRRLSRTIILTLSSIIIVPCAVLALGVFFPTIPYVGAFGSLIWSAAIGPVWLLVLVGVLLAVAAFWLGRRRTTLVLVGVGVITLTGTSVVFGSQIAPAVEAGAPISLAMFGPPLESATPDDEIAYMTDNAGKTLNIDIYEPNADVVQPDNGAPILVYVHGGGWVGGDPKEISADLRWFADQGYWVLSPEYTLATAGNPTWNSAMPQVGCALIWASENAADYGGDPERIAMLGGSAGANVALTTAYAASTSELTPACDGEIPDVQAVAGDVPAVDPAFVYHNADPLIGAATRNMVTTFIGGSAEKYPERVKAVQAATYLTSQAPPTFLSVSESDHLVSIESVKGFISAAQAKGVDLEVHYRPWADHATSSAHNYLPNQTLIRRLHDFFRSNGV